MGLEGAAKNRDIVRGVLEKVKRKQREDEEKRRQEAEQKRREDEEKCRRQREEEEEERKLREEREKGQEFTFEIVTVNSRGKITNRRQGSARQKVEQLANDVTLEMVYIPGGTFTMGSPESEENRDSDEGPQHQVKVPPFYLGKYPVTQAQYQAVMGNNPSSFKGEKTPGGKSLLARCRTILPEALPEDWQNLSLAFGGRVGVCLPGGNYNAVLFWRDFNSRVGQL